MIVDVDGVTFYYNSIPALNSVTVRFEPGRTSCLLGPNGAGKTTLLKVIASILHPSRGVVYIDGKDSRLYSPRELSKIVAYEDPYISRSLPMTVLDFILTARYPHQRLLQYFESSEDLKVVECIAKELDIVHLLDRKLDQISSGELQRVIIAHALAKRPRVMLLDEPSAFLDIRYRFEILDYIKRCTAREHLSTIVALHDLHLASIYCDFVVIMSKGVIVAYGDPNTVLKDSIIEQVYGVKVKSVDIGNGVTVIVPLPRAF